MIDNNNWRPTPPGGVGGGVTEAALDGGDWRAQLPPESRERIVNKIMETLKRHLPVSGPEGLQEQGKIAMRFEEKIYTAATSQSDYLRKISLKMLRMEPKSQSTIPNALPSNSAGNSSKDSVIKMPMEIGENDGSVEMLRNIHISSYDEDNDDDADREEVEDLMNDDDDDIENDEVEKPVTLGFVEKPKNKWSLLRQLFPSKAGGVPAWLDPNDLPSGRSRLCDICGEPLQFLLQVYAPTSDRESTFHRALYLFACPSMSCLLRDQHEQWKRPAVNASRSVKVFRCQLPRDNPFYSTEPPRHNGSDKPLGSGAPLCNWCGTWKGDKVCGSCREARYCSEKHQAMHWRSGHKVTCQNSSTNAGNSSAEDQKPASRSLWPEYEIVNEDEAECDVDVPTDLDNTNCLVSRNQMDDSINSLIDCFQGDSDRRSWGNFQERIARAPEQVLRYCRNVGARPLWPMSSGQPSTADIPNCSYCGKARCFELQVLPQLLYFFGVKNDADSLDWATIVVYSCEASCDGAAGYKEEFAWVQVSSPSQVVS